MRRVLEGHCRPYRMPREAYRGLGSVFYTICTKNERRGFGDVHTINYCMDALKTILPTVQTRADAFCFMPNHVHVLATGMLADADSWEGIVRFKQTTGKWFWSEGHKISWQRRFDARILNAMDSVEPVAAYILNNPVRAGLVTSWQDYPHSGRIEWQPRRYHI